MPRNEDSVEDGPQYAEEWPTEQPPAAAGPGPGPGGRRRLLNSSDDVTQLRAESRRARLLCDVTWDDLRLRTSPSIIDIDTPYCPTSTDFNAKDNVQITYPSIMSALRWLPRSAARSSTSTTSTKFVCHCKKCRTTACSSRSQSPDEKNIVLSSKSRHKHKPSVAFKTNTKITSFCDHSTMTPNITDACCSAVSISKHSRRPYSPHNVKLHRNSEQQYSEHFISRKNNRKNTEQQYVFSIPPMTKTQKHSEQQYSAHIMEPMPNCMPPILKTAKSKSLLMSDYYDELPTRGNNSDSSDQNEDCDYEPLSKSCTKSSANLQYDETITDCPLTSSKGAKSWCKVGKRATSPLETLAINCTICEGRPEAIPYTTIPYSHRPSRYHNDCGSEHNPTQYQCEMYKPVRLKTWARGNCASRVEQWDYCDNVRQLKQPKCPFAKDFCHCAVSRHNYSDKFDDESGMRQWVSRPDLCQQKHWYTAHDESHRKTRNHQYCRQTYSAKPHKRVICSQKGER